MYARLPVDHWVGVNTHKLNQLWCGGDSRELSAWLQRHGKVFVAHECESEHYLFQTHKNIRLSSGNTAKDTWICFSGPGEKLSPLKRGLPFKVMDVADVQQLAEHTDANARVLRLIKYRLTSKKPAAQPSPPKPATPTPETAAALENYDHAGAIATLTPTGGGGGFAGGSTGSDGEGFATHIIGDGSSMGGGGSSTPDAITAASPTYSVSLARTPPRDQSPGLPAQPAIHVDERAGDAGGDVGEPWEGTSRRELHHAKSSAELAARAANASAASARGERESMRRERDDARRERNTLASQVTTLTQKLEGTVDADEHAQALQVQKRAVDENIKLRARENALMHKAAAAQRTVVVQLAELQQLRRGEALTAANASVRELEELAARHRATIQRLRDQLSEARVFERLTPLDEPPDSLNAYEFRMRRRKDGTVYRVTRLKEAVRKRLKAVRDLAKSWFSVGWVWAFGVMLSSTSSALVQFLALPKVKAAVQKLIDRSVNEVEKEADVAERAYCTRLENVVGRRRWSNVRNGIKFTFDSEEALANPDTKVRAVQRRMQIGMYTIKQVDDMCTSHAHNKARARLIERFGPLWKDEIGEIERLYNDDGVEVGAYADVYGMAFLCLKSGLEHAKYHKHVKIIILHDSEGAYLYVVMGDGCDEWPRNRRNTATEGSLSNRFEFGAACSSERQFLYFEADAKETGSVTTYVLKKKDISVARIRATLDPHQRRAIDVILPQNADPKVCLITLCTFGPTLNPKITQTLTRRTRNSSFALLFRVWQARRKKNEHN